MDKTDNKITFRYEWQDCWVELQHNILKIGNQRLRRIFLWEHGQLSALGFETSERYLSCEPVMPCLWLPGEAEDSRWGTIEIEEDSETSWSFPCLKVILTSWLNNLMVRRVFRVYPNLSFIAMDIGFKGSASEKWEIGDLKENDSNLKSGKLEEHSDLSARLERLTFPFPHFHYTVYEFHDPVCCNGNLIQTYTGIPNQFVAKFRGNMVILEFPLSQTWIGLLKESPFSFFQYAYPGYDFAFCQSSIDVHGLGVNPSDVKMNSWTWGYSIVMGVSHVSHQDLLTCLRQYQHVWRRIDWQKEEVRIISVGKFRDEKKSGTLLLRTLSILNKIGANYLQLDGEYSRRWSDQSIWGDSSDPCDVLYRCGDIDLEEVSSGFDSLLAFAKREGIHLCLKFVLDTTNDYENWEKDADQLLNLYHRYGIKVFELDNIQPHNKQSERNLRQFFEKVLRNSNGEVVINLGIFSTRQLGFFFFNRYGVKTLGNNKSDWGNFYPHWMLRNIWILAHFYPPQFLRIECFNFWRDRKLYAKKDVLAPHRIPLSYSLAVGMVGQPLLWLDPEDLKEKELRELAEIIRVYIQHSVNFHRLSIWPIGDEPNGCNWTGFQAKGENQGYFLVYRGYHPSSTCSLSVSLPPGSCWRITSLIGDFQPEEMVIDEMGRATFYCSKRLSFLFCSYFAK